MFQAIDYSGVETKLFEQALKKKDPISNLQSNIIKG